MGNLGLSIINDDKSYDMQNMDEYMKDNRYYEHWYLASLAFKDEKYAKISIYLLNETVQKNSNKEHVNSCLNNIYLHQKIKKCAP